MEKEFLINMAKKIGENEKYWSLGNKKVGAGNIRAVANLCENTDLYDEVRLFIQYKIAKGNGWQITATEDGKKFGELVLEDIEKIYVKNNSMDKEALKSMSLYFGYLYWVASIEDSKHKDMQYREKGNNNYRGDNKRQGTYTNNIEKNSNDNNNGKSGNNQPRNTKLLKQKRRY